MTSYTIIIYASLRISLLDMNYFVHIGGRTVSVVPAGRPAVSKKPTKTPEATFVSESVSAASLTW